MDHHASFHQHPTKGCDVQLQGLSQQPSKNTGLLLPNDESERLLEVSQTLILGAIICYFRTVILKDPVSLIGLISALIEKF